MSEPEKAILRLISESDYRIPADEIYHHLCQSGRYRRREVRAAIRSLLDSGELNYTYELGQSFLERSFNRPIQVTPKITLAPPGHAIAAKLSEVTVRLAPGAAFGYGQHPTTRMALAAVDKACTLESALLQNGPSRVLDIGTGSGVLIIAAVKLGLSSGLGLDIDPCALAEAEQNVTLNNLQSKIQIKNIPLDSVPGRYQMITANLRLPTLVEHRASIVAGVLPGGMLIISGIKTEELSNLMEHYTSAEVKKLQVWSEKGWSALLMQKGAGKAV